MNKIKIIKKGNLPALKENPALGEPTPKWKKLSVTLTREQWIKEHKEKQQAEREQFKDTTAFLLGAV